MEERRELADRPAEWCGLLESLDDDAGVISVAALPLPPGAGVAVVPWTEERLVVAGGTDFYVVNTTGAYCDSIARIPLPANFDDLGEAMAMTYDAGTFFVAYEGGVVAIDEDFRGARRIVTFADTGGGQRRSPTTIVVVSVGGRRMLLVGGWDEFDEFDEERAEQVLEIYGGELKGVPFDDKDRAFQQLMGMGLRLIDVETGEVFVSSERHTTFDIRVVDDGVFVAIDFGPDVVCPTGGQVRAKQFFHGCVPGGAQSSMSVTPVPGRHVEALGLAETDETELLWVPEDRTLTVVTVHLGDEVGADATRFPMDTVGQRGGAPFAWAMQPLDWAGVHYVIASGRFGPVFDGTLFSSLGLRDTCFSVQSLDGEGTSPAFQLGSHVCTSADGLVSPSRLFPVACADEPEAECFAGVAHGTPGAERAIYFVTVRPPPTGE